MFSTFFLMHTFSLVTPVGCVSDRTGSRQHRRSH